MTPSRLTARAARRSRAAGLLLLVAGCAAAGGRGRQVVDPRFQRSFEALGAAVEAGDDATARRVLAGILARAPEGVTLERADAYLAILDGREVGRALALALRSEPTGTEDGAYRLVLVARGLAAGDVRLELPPSPLERLSCFAFAGGSDARTVDTSSCSALSGTTVPAGAELALDLGTFVPDVEGALARRDLWRLDPRGGEAVLGDRRLPLQGPPVETCEVVRLASFLPPEPLGPEPLLEYVCRSRIASAPLMERAVRIPPERWDETLDRLAGLSESFSDERLTAIAPALRWLARSPRLGADPRAWRAALARGFARGAPPALDLPDDALEGAQP